VARGPAGELYVSYKLNEDVFLAKSIDGGNTFSAAKTVNANPTHEPEVILPYMGVDSLGRIDMVWRSDPDNDGDDNSLRYARSTNGGTSFSSDIEIANSGMAGFVRPMGLVHDESGRVHVQYQTDRNDSDPNNPLQEIDVYYLRAE
jgi:hypothetical protein